MTALSVPCHSGTTIPAAVRAVVFDMDGVLLDTERIWGLAEARLCERYGVTFGPTDEQATLGLLSLEACRHYARRFGLDASEAPRLERELVEMMCEELEGSVPPLPGARALVERLVGRVALAVASNSRRSVVVRSLERSGLADAFDTHLSADDVPRPKPAPDVYLAACARLCVPPAEALALEDSPVGATAAVAAGLRCIAVMPEPPADRLGVDRWIRSLTELLAPEA
jgi:HAD superfamily hydrolase (TIGR01509 family)